MRPTDLDDLSPLEPSDDLLAAVRARGGSFSRRRHMTRLARVGSGVLVVALVAAIALSRGGDGNRRVSTAPPTVTSTTVTGVGVQQLKGAWLPTAIAGYDGPLTGSTSGEAVRVTFGPDGKWSGYDGCNWNFGSYRVGQRGAFHFNEIGATLRGCFRASAPIHTLDATVRLTLLLPASQKS